MCLRVVVGAAGGGDVFCFLRRCGAGGPGLPGMDSRPGAAARVLVGSDNLTGRPRHIAPHAVRLRARALDKMPGGCRFGRAASNRKASTVLAGEGGGGANAHSDRPEGFSSHAPSFQDVPVARQGGMPVHNIAHQNLVERLV